MTERGEVIAVLRRRFDYWLGWTLTVGATVLLIAFLLQPTEHATWWNQFVQILILFPPVWLGWLVTVHPKIVVRTSGLMLVNWFVKYWIPWSEVDSVDVDEELSLVLRDGRRIRLASGAPSLASALQGNRLQRDMHAKIEKARIGAGSGAGGVVERSLDLHAGKFLAVGLALVILGWFAVR